MTVEEKIEKIRTVLLGGRCDGLEVSVTQGVGTITVPALTTVGFDALVYTLYPDGRYHFVRREVYSPNEPLR